MKMKNIVKIITTVCFFSFFTSCVKDDMELDPDKLTKFDRPLNFAGPIANIHLKAADLIGKLGEGLDEHIRIDDDGLLNARYTDSVIIEWDDIVKLENIHVDKNYPFIIPPGETSLNQQITFAEKIKINKNPDQRFDSMYIESALMYLDIQFPSELSGQVHIDFPGVSINGETVELIYDSETANSHIERDLEGHFIEFEHGIDSSYILMHISPENIQAQDNLGGAYNFNVSLSLSETLPEVTFGSFGTDTVYDEQESLVFSLLTDLKAFEMIEFYDILLQLDFLNYYGVDYDCKLEDAFVSSSYKMDTLDITFSGDNTMHVEAAQYTSEVEPVQNVQDFNNTNSNIQDAVNILPDKMDYRMLVTTNTTNPGANNFVTQENKISGLVDVIIPMWFRCEKYTRVDTIHSFDINNMIDDTQMEFLDSIVLTFEITNFFPFDIDVQCLVVDSNLTIIDSLFTEAQKMLVSGPLDTNDKVIEAGESKTIDIILNKEKVQSLKDANAKKLLISSKTTTSENGSRFVKIFEHYGIDFHVSLEIVSDEI